MARCTCGYDVFSERRSTSSAAAPCWVLYSSTPAGGLGSSPLGGSPFGSGEEGGAAEQWARLDTSIEQTTLETRCSSCSRVRSARTLTGLLLVAAFRDEGTIYFVGPASSKLGCFFVEFRGPVTARVPLRRDSRPAPATTPIYDVEEILETPPEGAVLAAALYRADIPEIAYDGVYEIVLVNACADTEVLSLDPAYLEPAVMNLLPRDAELDAPPVMVRAPLNTNDANTNAAWPVVETLRFEKCEGVLEYDARLQSLPEVQGWTRVDTGSAQFAIVNGALRQTRSSGAFDGYYAQLVLDEVPDTVKGYAVMRPMTASASVLFGAGDATEAIKGARVDSVETATKTVVAPIAMDGGSADTAHNFPSGWVRVGAVRDPDNTGAVVAAEQEAYGSAFASGDYPGSPIDFASAGIRIEGHFGLLTPSPADPVGVAMYRTVVVSAPGLFIRPRFRSVSLVTSPVVRLQLFVEPFSGARTARFKIKYGTALQNPQTPVETGTVSTTCSFSADNLVHEFALALTDLGVGPFWFSLERDWQHADDTVEATVHMVQASVRAA